MPLAPGDAYTPAAHLRIEQPATGAGVGSYTPSPSYGRVRDTFLVPHSTSTTTVQLAPH